MQKVQKKIGIPQSQLAQETMRSEIRHTTLEKTFGEQGTLSQAVVRIVKPEIKKATEMQAEAERRRSERDQQSEINLARGKQPDRDSVEQHNKHVSDGTNKDREDQRSERLQQIRS